MLTVLYLLSQAETGDSSQGPMKVQESDQSSHADKESPKGGSESNGSNISQAKR